MCIGVRCLHCNIVRKNVFRKFCAGIAVMTPNEAAFSGVFQSAEEADMKEAKIYREYAADCIRMAKRMNPKDQQALLEMAEAWDERAREAERQENKPDGG
jgi:hypothetical protein